ncbi:OB-fold nucleic acid binding domain-containing protein [Streptomyces sp. ODS28]|uniref:OB-fold nucleic acid binding domain-containing protein n=1 Tax=Streptomyces sp. ODS28 TaxID=3136688 RepID=UPI0031EAA43D
MTGATHRADRAPGPVDSKPRTTGGNRFRRFLERLGSSEEDLRSEELRQDADSKGCTRICDCGDRQIVRVTGTLRTVTLRPRAGVPTLEAELFDGSASLDVIWLGRRAITGIEPGRRLIAWGRISTNRGRPVMFNPKYELRPLGQE